MKSLASMLTTKNILVGLGLIGVGIVGLKMITGGKVPPSRPTATKVAAQSQGGNYWNAGNMAANDDIPVINSIGSDWEYETALGTEFEYDQPTTGMLPDLLNLDGNAGGLRIANAFYTHPFLGRGRQVVGNNRWNQGNWADKWADKWDDRRDRWDDRIERWGDKWDDRADRFEDKWEDKIDKWEDKWGDDFPGNNNNNRPNKFPGKGGDGWKNRRPANSFYAGEQRVLSY